jgi:hypothetical protein
MATDQSLLVDIRHPIGGGLGLANTSEGTVGLGLAKTPVGTVAHQCHYDTGLLHLSDYTRHEEGFYGNGSDLELRCGGGPE